ncbi:MAG TPA: nickel pincer cofactor biosynthesis protein LarB [Planctomycetes bacterium]|nr:nickel pincer cofactor biosynthesis protein LarB [Fuerstiella sp.]HIK96445.1 nickel pincer cofactor biosynthesis protein LarB [Planctomycetota bacterium]
MLPGPDQIRNVLSNFLTDSTQCEAAVRGLLQLTETATIDGADVDIGRASRCGFPEVIFGEGKPPELIVEILKRQHAAGQRGLVTRISHDQAELVKSTYPDARHNPIARTVIVPAACDTIDDVDAATTDSELLVAVVTAGSCDTAVAQEAVETLRWMNVACTLIEDVGVAGPQRLQKHVSLLQNVRAIVCVAGMEAALPPVVGGLVGCPVIGVPTSVGYGASFGGITAMLSMLTCCASNVVTVNIDAGFRGGYVAGLIATGAGAGRVAVTSEATLNG